MQPYALKNKLACDQLQKRLLEPHIAPITKLVEQLRKLKPLHVPDVDPRTGGINARLLFVLLSPGSGAKASRFLSIENPDPTAREAIRLFEEVGVKYDQVGLWNIVPWAIEGDPTLKDKVDGANALMNLLSLMKQQLKSIVFVGEIAREARSLVTLPKGVAAFGCYHWSPTHLRRMPEHRPQIVDVLRNAWARAC